MIREGKWKLFACLLTFGFVLISLLSGIDAMFLAVLTIWILGCIYVCANLQKRLMLGLFLISFFIFLVGGHLVHEYFGMELKHYFGDEYYFHSNFLLFLSLVALLAGFAFAERIKGFSPERQIRRIKWSGGETTKLRIRKISKILYYATYLIWLAVMLEKVIFVQLNSYNSFYAEYVSSLPFFIRAISSMTPYFLYLYLATFPSKKESWIGLGSYALYAALSLLTGRRSNMMFMFIFIVAYILLRHFRNKEEKWIKKKYVILVVIAAPVLVMFLYLYNYIRSDQDYSGFSLLDMFLGFFQQQGFSSSILRLELYHESSLPSDTYYSLFGIVKFFRTNTILKLLFNPQYDFSYLHNNVAFALEGNSLANTLSYLELWNYLDGAGTGTCYIAELYHDFWLPGVLMGNFLYGVVIQAICKVFSKKEKFSIWFTAICFALVEAFLKAPRWNFDIIFTYFFDLGMWMAFITVFGLLWLVQWKPMRGVINRHYETKSKV